MKNMKKAWITLILLVLTSITIHAQCNFKLLSMDSRQEVPFAIPSAKGDFTVSQQGQSWIELKDKDGVLYRYPKISLDAYTKKFFKPGKIDPKRLKSETRHAAEQEDAEKEYEKYLTQYQCAGVSSKDEFQPFNVFVEGQVMETGGKPLKNAHIKVWKNEALLGTYPVADDGHYGVVLDTGKYTLEYTAPGYVAKRVMFDGRKMPMSEAKKGYTLEADVSLFKPQDGVDYSILQQTPIGLAEYSPKSHTYDFDKTYTKNIKNLIDQLEPTN